MTGKLIVFEGVDGSGKTTISRMFYEVLLACGQAALLTHEPEESCVAGEYIRSALRQEIQILPYTLATAFAVNRADHCDRMIAPALENGQTVICDRYKMSSLVYQVANDVSIEDVLTLNRNALQPDLTFYLSVSREIARERLEKRGGLRELFDADFDRLQRAYRREIEFSRDQNEAVIRIDANFNSAKVLKLVLDAYDDYYRELKFN